MKPGYPWIHSLGGILLHLGVCITWDSCWRLWYRSKASRLQGWQGIEHRQQLKREVRAKLSPLGAGFSEWANRSRVGLLEGKNAG